MVSNLALQLRAAGLGVFPCQQDKAPAVPKGVSWQTVAQQDPQAINWPSGVIGVPIPPGVVVLDLDTYKGVTREQVDAALGVRLPWDRALVQTTQNGGQHYAFAVDWLVKYGSNVGNIKGLDTRTAGKGYIATGNGYTQHGFGVFAMSQPAGLPRLPEQCRPALEHVDRTPTQPAELPTGDKDINAIRQALSHVAPQCNRTEWVRIGLALRHHFHDDLDTGFALFDEWSSGKLTATGDEPDNYSADTMYQQFNSFKIEGGVTIGSLFHTAISKGWTPPAGINTAAAFGAGACGSDVFDQLVDRITAEGGNAKKTNELLDAVKSLQCNDLQRSMLAAVLNRELKDAGLLNKSIKQQLEGGQPAQQRPAGLYGDNHTENAEQFLATYHPNGTLTRCGQVWYIYTGKAWAEIDDDTLRAMVSSAMWSSAPQANVVAGTITMMGDRCADNTKRCGDIDPSLVIYQNGVLDLSTGVLTGHRQDLFTTNILPYNYNPQAYSPVWSEFLNNIFEGDQERIALLQEWFGYMITNHYEHQKVMLMLGPPRCGKGTIGLVLKALVGDANYSGGTLSSFASDSFIDSLQYKTVMFIGDAAKSVPKGQVDYVMERMKGISGCDEQSFERKYKSSMTTHIPTRITIASNHIPKLFDDSGALANRMLILPFDVSWLGREDPTLIKKLLAEIEGIAIWALQGLARLTQQGRFTAPAASEAETQYIKESFSSLVQFKDEVLLQDPNGHASATEVYEAYRVWALNNQEDHVLTRRMFVSSFKEMIRGFCKYTVFKPDGGKSTRGFVGLTIRPQQGQGGSIPLTAVK